MAFFYGIFTGRCCGLLPLSYDAVLLALRFGLHDFSLYPGILQQLVGPLLALGD